MDNDDLIRQLKMLKTVQPSQDWAVSAKKKLVAAMGEDTATQRERSGMFTGLARLPRFALAFPAFALVFALSFALLGSHEGDNPTPSVATQIDVPVEQDVAFIASAVPQAPRAEHIARADEPEQDPADVAVSALRAYDEDLDVAFRTSLLERLNRATVVAQDENNTYVRHLMGEAQALFDGGDYDAALRVVVLAEKILGIK